MGLRFAESFRFFDRPYGRANMGGDKSFRLDSPGWTQGHRRLVRDVPKGNRLRLVKAEEAEAGNEIGNRFGDRRRAQAVGIGLDHGDDIDARPPVDFGHVIADALQVHRYANLFAWKCSHVEVAS